MHLYPTASRRFIRNRIGRGWRVAPLLVFLAFFANSCGCDHEVHIRAGQGAEGMVPGTINAQRGQTICWINDDAVAHTVIFTNSPGQGSATAQSIDILPGKKKSIKVHASKPSGTYECHIVPPARTDGLWPPTEPQVIVE